MTPALKETFLVIDSFWKMYGFGPSVDDILYMTGEKSRSNTQRKMWALVDLGICKGVRGRSRSIRPAYLRVRDIE